MIIFGDAWSAISKMLTAPQNVVSYRIYIVLYFNIQWIENKD